MVDRSGLGLDRNRKEIASGFAGSAVHRKQSAIDSLTEVYNSSSGSASTFGQGPDIEAIRSGLLSDQQNAGLNIQPYLNQQWEPTPRIGAFDPTVGILGPEGGYPDAVSSSPLSVLDDPPERQPLAGGDDALTRAVATIANTADFDFQSNTLKTAFDRARSDFYAEQEAQVAGLAAQYQSRIGALNEELAGYRGGLAGVNQAYASYADDANAILAEAAAVEADPLTESTSDVEIAEDFEEFDGAMQDTLKKIDSSGNKDLAKAMSNEVRYMEETMVDGLRSGLATQDELHALAGAQAQALAHMAWKDDVYQAEKSRFTLETQINKTIADKQDEIAAQTAAMNDAIANARAQFGEFAMTPDELWAAGMNDYFANTELDDFQVQEIMATWASIKANAPNAFRNYEEFKGEVMAGVNYGNLQTLGLADKYTSYLTWLESNGTPEQFAKYDGLLESSDATGAIRQMVDGMVQAGVLEGGQYSRDYLDGQDLRSSSSFETKTMLDLWNHYDDFSRNYNDYVQTQASNLNTPNVARGRTAPNNAGNKYNNDYIYRRETVAPYFAEKVKAAFPGAEIGGLGYIRDANDGGGANVSNSDHHSGGAIDIYHKAGSAADTDRMLRQIVQWLDQPGVSFTVYDGQSAHQTGNSNAHVHASFQVGWRLP